MPRTRITLQQVQSYVRKKIPALLRKDLKAYRLLRESDVECATYMHLRRLLDVDQSWTVTARRHVPQTGRFVDIVIFHETTPKIAIELKWGLREIDPKDRDSLGEAINVLGVNKAYWISAAVLGKPAVPLAKQAHEKYSLHVICVRAELLDEQVKHWESFRDSLRSKLEPGTGRKRKTLSSNSDEV
ncbi:MAG: hypothetical protein IV088_01900 [Hydrogenophaga sp.]|uniref:hypothetical protein n=1 Tax=Hydrogenophaga sp. TaxID=1904254 RepID=UPI0025B7F498|nr:hypothetical protein [Hydrogenophaga sp.]MBT9549576.1 hypothetical protein [Hydrogenophaga sp.]